MFRRRFVGSTLSAALVALCSSAFAGWGFNGPPFPNASIQTCNMTLELQCDRMRFVPAGYEDAQNIERQIEYRILAEPADQWDALVTINGETMRALTAYSYFGKSEAPRGFVVALLGEDRSEFLVFRDGDEDWLEFGEYSYRKCN